MLARRRASLCTAGQLAIDMNLARQCCMHTCNGGLWSAAGLLLMNTLTPRNFRRQHFTRPPPHGQGCILFRSTEIAWGSVQGDTLVSDAAQEIAAASWVLSMRCQAEQAVGTKKVQRTASGAGWLDLAGTPGRSPIALYEFTQPAVQAKLMS
jgi:hypothetical protein